MSSRSTSVIPRPGEEPPRRRGQRKSGQRPPSDPRTARLRILRAAEHVFASKGYAGATTQQIARLAGVQKRMVFYYFSSKNALYGQVLDGFLAGIRDIHARFHEHPGPVGLQKIVEGIIRFVAANPDPVRILLREIMDDGPHLRRIVDRYVGPLFAEGIAETRRNMTAGVFQPEDPMHALINIGGLTVFYLLILPLLRQVWDRDPLAPETLDERVDATIRFVRDGMLAATLPAEAPRRAGAEGGRPAS
jgi:AcrR family transcriptional regulator